MDAILSSMLPAITQWIVDFSGVLFATVKDVLPTLVSQR